MKNLKRSLAAQIAWQIRKENEAKVLRSLRAQMAWQTRRGQYAQA